MQAVDKVFNNEAEDEQEDGEQLINVFNNHVYFYSDVNPKSALKLNMILKKLFFLFLFLL